MIVAGRRLDDRLFWVRRWSHSNPLTQIGSAAGLVEISIPARRRFLPQTLASASIFEWAGSAGRDFASHTQHRAYTNEKAGIRRIDTQKCAPKGSSTARAAAQGSQGVRLTIFLDREKRLGAWRPGVEPRVSAWFLSRLVENLQPLIRRKGTTSLSEKNNQLPRAR